MRMKLQDALSDKQGEILSQWFDAVAKTYPAETATFLMQQQNRFTNPVGSTIRDGLKGILGELSGDADPAVASFLDNIIRIRAVQDFSPSAAVSFVMTLKDIVRRVLGELIVEHGLAAEVEGLNRRIDTISLLAFDIFMQCREKLYEVKAHELQRMTYRLLQQANLIAESKLDEKAAAETSFLNLSRKEVST